LAVANQGGKCGVGQLVTVPSAAAALWQVSTRRFDSGGLGGAFKIKCEMKSILYMDPRVRQLIMLSALAALGCGLAAAQGDLLFVAIFGAACALTIIEAIRRLR
jgi:alkylhydroperoxidase/carboxymuconolactone decarboxylase family protein YurZ